MAAAMLANEPLRRDARNCTCIYSHLEREFAQGNFSNFRLLSSLHLKYVPFELPMRAKHDYLQRLDM
jgi:hypothetical protein